ncbi:MAG: anti-sigma factor [Phycisphaerae bacterium]
MNCAEWENLSDAYLDGQLSGTLRLEFDAHRLRCRRCQQSLALAEACEHVLANDRRTPALSADFSDRLMSTLARSRVAGPRRVPWRALSLANAAVVVLAAGLLWSGRTHSPAPNQPGGEPTPPATIDLARMDPVDLSDYLWRRVEAARSGFANDLGQLARYPLSITVSDDVARASTSLTTSNPLSGLFEAFLPAAHESDEPTPGDSDQYAL